jgi:ubiquitin-like 1-activating enzyme E1 B
VLQPQALDKPDPKCYICGKVSVNVSLDTGKFTLKQFYESVLRKRLGMNKPCIDVDNKDNFVGTEDEHSADHLSKPLEDVGIKIEHGASLVVDDYSQALECRINIVHRDDIDELEHPELFILSGDLPEAQAETEAEVEAVAEAETETAAEAGEREVISLDDDDVQVQENKEETAGANNKSKKRALSSPVSSSSSSSSPSSSLQNESKKQKVNSVEVEEEDDDIIIL